MQAKDPYTQTALDSSIFVTSFLKLLVCFLCVCVEGIVTGGFITERLGGYGAYAL